MTGTAPQAQLLAGWLRSRLDRPVAARARAGRPPRGRRDRRQGRAVSSGRSAAALRPALGAARPVRARPDLRRSRTLRGEMNDFTVHVKPLIADVPGWLTDEEGEALYDLARACYRQGRDRRDRLLDGQVDDLSRARLSGRSFRSHLCDRSAHRPSLRGVQGEYRPGRDQRARHADRVALATGGGRLPRTDRAALRRRLARVRPRARGLREVGAQGCRRWHGSRSTTRPGPPGRARSSARRSTARTASRTRGSSSARRPSRARSIGTRSPTVHGTATSSA